MNFPIDFISKSEKETIQVAEKFSSVISIGDVICLNGDLGSGKTVFVKALCKQFDIDNVSSPSFAIVNEYNGKTKIYHFDFYRLKSVKELYEIGFDDYLLDNNSILVIEWAELFNEILPLKRYDVSFNIFDGTKRKISIRKNI